MQRIVIGMTGASGIQYAFDLLETLQNQTLETHLIISEGAKRVLAEELKMNSRDLNKLVTQVHDDRDVGAGIASGSFRNSISQ